MGCFAAVFLRPFSGSGVETCDANMRLFASVQYMKLDLEE